MTLPLADMLSIAGLLVGVTVAVGLAMLYIVSRVRRASDALREEYITGLERDRIELKSDNAELSKRNTDLRAELSELRGQVRVLQNLVLNGHCRRFEQDTLHGGCVHCDIGAPRSLRLEDERG